MTPLFAMSMPPGSSPTPIPKPVNKVTVTIDSRAYVDRSEAIADMGLITSRLNQTQSTALSVASLAYSVGATGHTFAPAQYNGNRSSENWISQQVFPIDIDDGLTIPSFLQRCQTLDIHPAFIYTTFRHTTAAHRYRAVFVMDQVITDDRVREFINRMFLAAFPEADAKCVDGARIFFGGAGIAHADYNATLNPIDLLDASLQYMRGQDPKNFARNSQRFMDRAAQTSGLGCFCVQDNGWMMDSDAAGQVEGFPTSPYIYYGHVKNPSTYSAVLRDGQQYLFHWKSKELSEQSEYSETQKYAVRAVQKRTKALMDEDKRRLRSKCRLLDEFMAGTRHLGNEERRLLLSNLHQYRNGVAWYKQGLESRTDYHSDKRLLDSAKRYDWLPNGCHYCRYDGTCSHKKNLLQQLPLKQREIRRVETKLPGVSVDVMRDRLRTAIDEALAADDHKVYVIKSDTGIGKTELLLSRNLNGCCVAFPHASAQGGGLCAILRQAYAEALPLAEATSRATTFRTNPETSR